MDTCEHELLLSAVIGISLFAIEQLLAASSCDSNSSTEFILSLIRYKKNECTSLKQDVSAIDCA